MYGHPSYNCGTFCVGSFSLTMLSCRFQLFYNYSLFCTIYSIFHDKLYEIDRIQRKHFYSILTFLTNKMNNMPLLEIKTSKITSKGQIAIPKDIREIEGFKEGTKVAILAFENRIELRPLQQVNERLFTALASEKSLAKDWLSKEDAEAWKDL